MAGFCAYWFDAFVVDQFPLPTVRETAIIASGDRSFLENATNCPEWLQIASALIENFPLVAGLGMVFLAAGSKTVRGSFGHLP